ncbi:MAG: hypothetical protein EON87_10980 [Brevundimonas sp.]|nr:MAG: hypothetical protein EON87_10980 [Brevundimonas sp.]
MGPRRFHAACHCPQKSRPRHLSPRGWQHLGQCVRRGYNWRRQLCIEQVARTRLLPASISCR